MPSWPVFTSTSVARRDVKRRLVVTSGSNNAENCVDLLINLLYVLYVQYSMRYQYRLFSMQFRNIVVS